MIKQILPFNPLFGINDQHLPNNIFANLESLINNLRNIINFSVEFQLLILDIFEQIDHISCSKGWFSVEKFVEYRAD